MSKINSDEIIEAISKSKNETLMELKSLLESNTSTILNEIKHTNKKVEQLEEEVNKLRADNELLHQLVTKQEKKINIFETQLHAKNIVLFGLEENSSSSYEEKEESLATFISSELEIEFGKHNIEKLRRIGQQVDGKTRPLLISLKSEKTKYEILKNSRKLKGSGIRIEEDFTKETQEIRKKLIPHLVHARNSGCRASLRGDKLKVNNKLYTLEELVTAEQITEQVTDDNDEAKEKEIYSEKPAQTSSGSVLSSVRTKKAVGKRGPNSTPLKNPAPYTLRKQKFTQKNITEYSPRPVI